MTNCRNRYIVFLSVGHHLGANEMTTAAAAAEYKADVSPDFTLTDAYGSEYLDVDPYEEKDEVTARQAVNARMAEWYGIG